MVSAKNISNESEASGVKSGENKAALTFCTARCAPALRCAAAPRVPRRACMCLRSENGGMKSVAAKSGGGSGEHQWHRRKA
jgi:hypothetical protein